MKRISSGSLKENHECGKKEVIFRRISSFAQSASAGLN
jgi:hypothetical protein